MTVDPTRPEPPDGGAATTTWQCLCGLSWHSRPPEARCDILHHYAAPLSGAGTPGRDATAWVIVRNPASLGLSYFTGFKGNWHTAWSADHTCAQRFATRAEAAGVLQAGLDHGDGAFRPDARVEEHMWVAPSALHGAGEATTGGITRATLVNAVALDGRLSVRTRSAFLNAASLWIDDKVPSLGQLFDMDDDALLRTRNIGVRSVQEIRALERSSTPERPERPSPLNVLGSSPQVLTQQELISALTRSEAAREEAERRREEADIRADSLLHLPAALATAQRDAYAKALIDGQFTDEREAQLRAARMYPEAPLRNAKPLPP